MTGRPTLLAILAATALIFVLLCRPTSPLRVGDASQYYAMLIALGETSRPWMTDESWRIYGEVRESGVIEGLQSSEYERRRLGALERDGKGDLGHFWMYSLLAVPAYRAASFLRLPNPLYLAFPALHLLLLLILVTAAWRRDGGRGAAAALVLTFASPVLWYINKAHTEFFTFSLATLAVIFLSGRNFLLSALCLALAGTQNPSLLICSLAVLAWGLFAGRGERAGRWLVPAIVATALVVVIHPLYYLWRHSVLSPQFLIAAAEPMLRVRHISVWIADPDIGLLPNWPLGAAALLLFLLSPARREYGRTTALFALLFLAVNLPANSMTNNFNSGGTVDVARYGLWYLCLFYPVFTGLFGLAARRKPAGLAFCAAVAFSIFLTGSRYAPWKEESFCTPTRLSFLIQKHFPGFYDPPIDIFEERYSGICHGITGRDFLAVVGPACTKVVAGYDRISSPLVLDDFGCVFDGDLLRRYFVTEADRDERGRRYMRITKSEAAALKKRVPPLSEGAARSYRATGPERLPFLARGWHLPESHGTWTRGDSSRIVIPLERPAEGNVVVVLEVTPFTGGTLTGQRAEVRAGGRSVGRWSFGAGDVGARRRIVIGPGDMADGGSMIVLDLNLPDAASPASLGLGDDRRELALAVGSVTVSTE